MTCVLRASGTDFDVDAFVASFPIAPDSIWRRGEPRFAQARPEGKRHDTSGLRILVSKADFSDLARQIADAVEFLRSHQDAIRALAANAGVTSVLLDFGAEVSPPFWSSFMFSPELLSLAGSAGVAVCLSVYPVETGLRDD
jgi:NAD(P)-dependent dehydrogenase (short-subunit alcohol dehydrogenase family)